MSTKYLPVNNFWCEGCQQLFVSLHRDDFKKCPCGNFIDGGFAYIRKSGKFESMRSLPLYWKKEVSK